MISLILIYLMCLISGASIESRFSLNDPLERILIVFTLAAGQLLMAYAFLRGLGFDGDLGTITVDMTGPATASGGHKVLSGANGKAEIESSRCWWAANTTGSDEAFRKTLRTMAQQYAWKTITTEQFQRLAESASKQELTFFFAQWVNSTGVPII